MREVSTSSLPAGSSEHDQGWDHGVFVPLLLARPEADIPVLQMSVLSSQRPSELFKLGQALAPLRDENIAIIGSGSASFHNMRHFFSGLAHDPAFKAQHAAWRKTLDSALRIPVAEERSSALERWRDWDGSSTMHPPGRAEHFSPLIVCAGAAGDFNDSTQVIEGWEDSMAGLNMQNWVWKDI